VRDNRSKVIVAGASAKLFLQRTGYIESSLDFSGLSISVTLVSNAAVTHVSARDSKMAGFNCPFRAKSTADFPRAPTPLSLAKS